MKLEEAIQQAIEYITPEGSKVNWSSPKLIFFEDQRDGDFCTYPFDKDWFISKVGEFMTQDLPENETIVTDANGKRFLVTVKEL